MLMCNVASSPPEKYLMSVADAESLASSEESDVDKLTCHCSLISSKSCAVDNWGAECASGKNVHCWFYNRNCS